MTDNHDLVENTSVLLPGLSAAMYKDSTGGGEDGHGKPTQAQQQAQLPLPPGLPTSASSSFDASFSMSADTDKRGTVVHSFQLPTQQQQQQPQPLPSQHQHPPPQQQASPPAVGVKVAKQPMLIPTVHVDPLITVGANRIAANGVLGTAGSPSSAGRPTVAQQQLLAPGGRNGNFSSGAHHHHGSTSSGVMVHGNHHHHQHHHHHHGNSVVSGGNGVAKRGTVTVSPAPAAILLKGEAEDVAFIGSHHCYTMPKAMRKTVTRQYREAEQIVVFVAVGDIVAARVIIASDIIPRAHARRSIPEVEAAVPAHWHNIFRVSNVSLFDAAALRLGLPCPLSDRSELPSHVDAGFAINRVWSATLLTFVDATIALSTGKADHYAELLEVVDRSDPDGGVPPEVRERVSAVKMVSHGPGVVVLGYIARRFGREGREFVANCLFELNAGVIDLCRNSIGGALISYLVRYGTCATPRILQLVPWRVVASRILCDQVGSQTASLMLHSALQFHRTTRRALEPVAVFSLTHRVLTKNFADATDPANECSLTTIASNAQSCRVLQLVVEASVELLAMHAAGTMTTATDEIVLSAQKVVTALCDLADQHAADPWSNYATQSLITACTLRKEDTPEAIAKGRYFDALLARVMVVIRPHIVRLACHKCGSNVIEKLCASRQTITTQVAAALLDNPGAYPRLASDRFGNYVIQTLLQHLPATLEVQVRDALLPVLGTLDRHWQCTVAIETWCRGVEERQRLLNSVGASVSLASFVNAPQPAVQASGLPPANSVTVGGIASHQLASGTAALPIGSTASGSPPPVVHVGGDRRSL